MRACVRACGGVSYYDVPVSRRRGGGGDGRGGGREKEKRRCAGRGRGLLVLVRLLLGFVVEGGGKEEAPVVVGGVEGGVVRVRIGLEGGVEGRSSPALLFLERFHFGSQPFLLLLGGGQGRSRNRSRRRSRRGRRGRSTGALVTGRHGLVVGVGVVCGHERQQLCALGAQGDLQPLLLLQSSTQSPPRLIHLGTPRRAAQGGGQVSSSCYCCSCGHSQVSRQHARRGLPPLDADVLSPRSSSLFCLAFFSFFFFLTPPEFYVIRYFKYVVLFENKKKTHSGKRQKAGYSAK